MQAKGTSTAPKTVQRLLANYGEETLSAQWFSQPYQIEHVGDCAVAYVTTPKAHVCIGLPVGPAPSLEDSMSAFCKTAKKQHKRVIWFGAEAQPSKRFNYDLIGYQPFWQKGRWEKNLKQHASLRQQLRRSASSNITLHKTVCPLQPHQDSLEHQLLELIHSWQQKRTLAPMSFVVGGLKPRSWQHKTVYWANLESKAIAALVVAPTPNGKRLLIEHIIRHPLAPNGTIERLFNNVVEDFERSEAQSLSLGLAPLMGKDTFLWKRIKTLGKTFYNFKGLENFKSKLRPSHWEPQYIVYDAELSLANAYYDVLHAFAGGSFLSFAKQSLKQQTAALFFEQKISTRSRAHSPKQTKAANQQNQIK